MKSSASELGLSKANRNLHQEPDIWKSIAEIYMIALIGRLSRALWHDGLYIMKRLSAQWHLGPGWVIFVTPNVKVGLVYKKININGILVRNSKHFVFFQLNSQQGQLTIGPDDVFALGKRNKISKIIITELFYPHMLNLNSQVLQFHMVWIQGFQAYSPRGF